MYVTVMAGLDPAIHRPSNDGPRVKPGGDGASVGGSATPKGTPLRFPQPIKVNKGFKLPPAV